MGKRESGAGDGTGEQDETKIYTDPEQAAIFVKETGIDALACSFGTTHGIYLTEPKLDFNVVKNVRKLTDNIPVVMHGGSGVSPEDYHKAVEAGVRRHSSCRILKDVKAGRANLLLFHRGCSKRSYERKCKACYEVFCKRRIANFGVEASLVVI